MNYSVSAVREMLQYICVFFFQAEDGIRDLVRSRGLGDVYKRQCLERSSIISAYFLEFASSRAASVSSRMINGGGLTLSLIHI